MKQRILIIGQSNATITQMAHGFLRIFLSDDFIIESAGFEPLLQINPLAKRLMMEEEIDISTNKPQHIQDVLENDYDFVLAFTDEVYAQGQRLFDQDKLINMSISKCVEGSEEEQSITDLWTAKIFIKLYSLRFIKDKVLGIYS